MSHQIDEASSSKSFSNMQDWMQVVRMPTAYRIGNSTLRCQINFVVAVAIVGVACLLFLYAVLPYSWSGFRLTNNNLGEHEHAHAHSLKDYDRQPYNYTYPLSPPLVYGRSIRYKIAVITDLDTDSKSKTEANTWISYLKVGYLTIDRSYKDVHIEWDESMVTLKGGLSQGGRGMELSELLVFNGKLYAFDDRTGVVYEINGNSVIPWVMLTDGSGRALKGFKSEWATVKNELLYVGGLGKEWTSSSGEIINFDPQWIKVVTPDGRIEHVDWRENYRKLCKAANILSPGYMIHEAVGWSENQKKWIFLPRRASHTAYNDVEDEERGTNLLIKADPNFSTVTVSTVGPKLPTHGFSSFKFIPGTADKVIVALKSEEYKGKVATYVTVFNIDGNVIYPETKIGNYKFEGIEFV